MKIQEVNEVNIPKMDFKISPEQFKDHCQQLMRRVICARVGKARYVSDENKVDHLNGIYLHIPQQKLTDFLKDPMTGNIYLRYILIPLFRQSSIVEAQ